MNIEYCVHSYLKFALLLVSGLIFFLCYFKLMYLKESGADPEEKAISWLRSTHLLQIIFFLACTEKATQ